MIVRCISNRINSVTKLARVPGRLRRTGLCVLMGWIGYGPAFGQTTGSVPVIPVTPATELRQAGLALDSLFFDFNQDISGQLLPLDELYALAMKYSPMVRFEGQIASVQQEAYRLSKVQVLQNLTGFANYSTGNQAILSTVDTGVDRLGQIANGYRAGINLTLSLHNLFGRPHEIQLAKANYLAQVERRRASENNLKRDVFVIYQDLLLAQRILHIRLQDDQASLAAYRIAEVELQKGKITPEAHAFNSNRYAQTKTTAEQAKTEFIKQIFNLELIVGLPISQLKRK